MLAKTDRLAQWALAISSQTDIEHGEDLLSYVIAARDAVLDCLQGADRGPGRPMIPILRYFFITKIAAVFLFFFAKKMPFHIFYML